MSDKKKIKKDEKSIRQARSRRVCGVAQILEKRKKGKRDTRFPIRQLSLSNAAEEIYLIFSR